MILRFVNRTIQMTRIIERSVEHLLKLQSMLKLQVKMTGIPLQIDRTCWMVSWASSATHLKSDFGFCLKNTWHSDGFPHRISRSLRTSQPFVLKVNTTLSCVTGNTAQPLTTAESLLALPGANKTTVWSHTHTPTSECTQTHTNANALKWADTRHAQMCTHACMCRHSPVLPVTCRQRYILCACVRVRACVRVYSHFPHLALISCHTIVLSLTLLIDFLFLWVVANVTFSAGAHTLVLSTASHPGYKNTGSFPGGVLHGKAMSISPCHTLTCIPWYI